jgi:tetratricopeptide (TPR) repeat protein
MTNPPEDQDAVIQPVGPLGAHRSSPAAQQATRPGIKFMVAGIGLFAGLLFVLLLLPRWFTDAPNTQPVVVEAPPSVVSSVVKLDPQVVAALREEAESMLTRVVVQEGQLAPLQPEFWAAVAWEKYSQTAKDGDDSFLAEDYAAAIRHYQSAIALGDALGERSGEILKAALFAGSEALRAGQANEAKGQFELAQRINGNTVEILQGLARADGLPQVLSAMSLALAADEAGEVEAAINAYEEALAIDPQWQPAADGLAAARGRLANFRFQRAMTAGLAGLDKQDYAAAAAAFERALVVRPNAPGALDGLLQVDQGRRLSRINLARIRSAAFEKQERWDEAAEQYAAALELDEAVVFAQQGLDRANTRADLSQKLALLIERPTRLFDAVVLADAGRLVEQGRATAPPKVKLDAQLATLAQYVEQAATPIDVTLVSDGLTEVTLYRVGRLTPFERKSFALRPGDYTAVGSRNGYRDVRAQFKLRPGRTPDPVVVTCTDPI